MPVACERFVTMSELTGCDEEKMAELSTDSCSQGRVSGNTQTLWGQGSVSLCSALQVLQGLGSRMSVALWTGVWKCLSTIDKSHMWHEREQEREEEKGTNEINR